MRAEKGGLLGLLTPNLNPDLVRNSDSVDSKSLAPLLAWGPQTRLSFPTSHTALCHPQWYLSTLLKPSTHLVEAWGAPSQTSISGPSSVTAGHFNTQSTTTNYDLSCTLGGECFLLQLVYIQILGTLEIWYKYVSPEKSCGSGCSPCYCSWSLLLFLLFAALAIARLLDFWTAI